MESKIAGVSWHKRTQKWRATICASGKAYHLGVFDKKEDAIAERKKAEGLLIKPVFQDVLICAKENICGVWLTGIKGEGKRFWVNGEDLKLALKYKWHLGGSKNNYVSNGGGKNRRQIHRTIMRRMDKELGKLRTDHINGDTLDNRRENLRKATVSQNGFNSSLSKRNTSGHKGVYKHSDGRWRVRITVKGDYKHIGLFDNEEDAIAARDEAEKLYFKEFARDPKYINKAEI